MAVTLTKDQLAMVNVSGHGLDEAARDQLIADVCAELESNGVGSTKNQVRAAVTKVLARGK